MSVRRCPSCGRAWDGALCMACGHEAVAGPPPQRAPSKAPPGRSTTPLTMRVPAAAPSSAAVPTVDPAAHEDTTVIPLPIASMPIPDHLKVKLTTLVMGPAAFVVVFSVAIVFGFGVGAAVAWTSHDPADLLQEGRIDDVITVINAKEEPSGDWMRIKGHALHAKGDLEGMLLAYQVAVAENAVDELGLTHTVEALGNEKVASLAIKTIEDWPGDEVDERLLAATNDPVWLRRHRAREALQVRKSATASMRLQAEVRNAVADTRADVCEHKLAGIKALLTLADNADAAPFLKKAGAWNAVYDINARVILQHRCLSEELVRRTDTALAKVERE